MLIMQQETLVKLICFVRNCSRVRSTDSSHKLTEWVKTASLMRHSAEGFRCSGELITSAGFRQAGLFETCILFLLFSGTS